MSYDPSFSQYQEGIKAAVKACNSEIKLLKVLQHEVQKYPVDWRILGKSLDDLTEINEQDEEHGLDMSGSIVEFLCALDNWRSFNETENKDSVCRVSENLMNILDFHFVENTPLERWLSVPELNTEFNKQILFLRNNQ